MKTLDRFLTKEFAKYFIYANMILVFIYIVIDLFEDLGKFIEKNVAIFSLIKYYFFITPSYIILLMPVGAMLSIFLLFGFMNRNREIIAIKSAGITVWRLFQPISIIGLSLVIFSFTFNEIITVWANEQFDLVKQIEIDKRPRSQIRPRRNFFYYGENNRIFFIRQIYPDKNELVNFTIWEHGDSLKIQKRVDAQIGKWDESGWTVYKVTIRDFQTDTTETVIYYDSLKLTGIREKPDDFLKQIKPLLQSNILTLLSTIKKKTRAGEDIATERVELNYRLSFPFINLILIMLGFPLSLILRKGGVAFGIGIGLLCAFTYWGLIQTFKVYGTANIISPFLSAWIPNLLFIVAGIILIITTKK